MERVASKKLIDFNSKTESLVVKIKTIQYYINFIFTH